MITCKEAYEIAKKLKSKIDKCDEFEGGFTFMSEEEAYSIGGGEGVCCVLKDNGRAINQTDFMDENAGEWIREIPLDEIK